MKEDFLHYLFKTKQLGQHFKSNKGEIIKILDFGVHNSNAGPDFLHAKVKIDDLIWAGHIEFHVKSSDWNNHNHQHDPAYNNVILHFVYEHDWSILVGHSELTTVEIKSLINIAQYKAYLNFLNRKSWIPCGKSIHLVDEESFQNQFKKVIFNRLERKASILNHSYLRFNNDYKKTFYCHLAKIFGGKVNGDNMMNLMEGISESYFKAVSFEPLLMEAILFGRAGLLREVKDAYSAVLKENFEALKKEFNIYEMNPVQWKYSRMHPQGFPDIRIAQFAAVLAQNNLFQLIIEKRRNIDDLILPLPNEYWSHRYRLGIVSPKKNTAISSDMRRTIQINLVSPFFFFLGEQNKDRLLKEESFIILKKTQSEKNTIISNWKKLNIHAPNAYKTQALIEQKNEWCSKKKCLFCSVGNNLLKN